jgi:hypothetical protein
MIGIIIHIFPQEIDQLEQTLINLKKSSKYFDNNQKFLVEVVLNFNFTKWNESKINKEFFTTKLSNLEDLTKSWAETDFWVSENNESLGCTDPRRICNQKYKADAFIWLDVDIVFSDTLLYHMVESFNILKETEPNLIITPEITRLWDNTWDVLVNESCFIEEANHKNYFSRDPYLTVGLIEGAELRKIDTFKFGGGWFTLLSNELLNKVPIPNEMGPYYMDDTFIMTCCIEGKLKGFNVSQYVIVNELIIENNKFRYNPYKNYLSNIDEREKYIQIARDNFNPSVINFINSL